MDGTTKQQAIPVSTITSENDDMIIIVRFKNHQLAEALGEEIARRGVKPVETESETIYQVAPDELIGLLQK